MSRALFAYYLSFNRIAICFICYIFVCNHESNMAMVLFCKETSTIGVIILLFFYTTAIDISVAIKNITPAYLPVIRWPPTAGVIFRRKGV